MVYSIGFKEAAVKKLLEPGSRGLKPLARDLGVTPQSLRKWRNQLVNEGAIGQMRKKKRQNWSAEEKYKAVLETEALNSEERSAYCRRNGLYEKDLALWKEQCLAGMRKGPKVDVEKKQLKAELKAMERDLNRKEKALAETTALLVLKKKLDLLFQEKKENW